MSGIVPPYLLERLSGHASDTVSHCAQRTLSIDLAVRERRAQRRGVDDVPAAAADETAPDRAIADARQTMQLPGTVVRREGEAPTGDASVDEAYDGLGATWAMLFEAFQRDSLDGKGRALLATVHYGDGYDNAFWDGERMVFGDGDGEVFRSFTGAVDVVGHELGHGLIEATVDLVYRDQSGALNESIADVIGSLVKQHVAGQRVDEADWLIGDSVFTDAVQGVALRSMRAPGTAYDDDVLGKDPQPATMADYVQTTSDNGGVHSNSGIPNHAYYLAATAIGGFAWEGAGRVWLDVLEQGSVAPDADFAAFAAATIEAARARSGEDAAKAVASAWQQVGVGGEAEAPPMSPASVVRIERSGGLLGRTRVGEVPAAALPADDADALGRLLASDRLEGLTVERPTPDAYVWRVSAPERPEVAIEEPALPDDVLALLHRLLERGEQR